MKICIKRGILSPKQFFFSQFFYFLFFFFQQFFFQNCTHLLISMKVFTMNYKCILQSIKYHSLGPYLQKSNKQIEEVVTMVRGSLSKMARITLGALIVIDVHGNNIIYMINVYIYSHKHFQFTAGNLSNLLSETFRNCSIYFQ
jgi:DNA integrity scanning protein DisA with diadenylate cyclase activity